MIPGSIKIRHTDGLNYTVYFLNDDQTPSEIEVSHQIARLLWTCIDQGEEQVRKQLRDIILPSR